MQLNGITVYESVSRSLQINQALILFYLPLVVVSCLDGQSRTSLSRNTHDGRNFINFSIFFFMVSFSSSCFREASRWCKASETRWKDWVRRLVALVVGARQVWKVRAWVLYAFSPQVKLQREEVEGPCFVGLFHLRCASFSKTSSHQLLTPIFVAPAAWHRPYQQIATVKKRPPSTFVAELQLAWNLLVTSLAGSPATPMSFPRFRNFVFGGWFMPIPIHIYFKLYVNFNMGRYGNSGLKFRPCSGLTYGH